MLLYLVRHAHAVSAEEDRSRPLSPRGIDSTRCVANFFRANGAFAPVEVWHSCLRRSCETAQILTAALQLDCRMVETDDLLPEDQPEKMALRLASMIGPHPLALVGHEPQLSSLATLLVSGRPYPPAFEMKKASVLALKRTAEFHAEANTPRWVAAWHLSPELFAIPAG